MIWAAYYLLFIPCQVLASFCSKKLCSSEQLNEVGTASMSYNEETEAYKN